MNLNAFHSLLNIIGAVVGVLSTNTEWTHVFDPATGVVVLTVVLAVKGALNSVTQGVTGQFKKDA